MTKAKRSVLFIVIFLAFFSTHAVCGGPHFVTPRQVDLTTLLPPPPPDGSPQTQAEISEILAIQKASTPRETFLAAAEEQTDIFEFASAVLGPGFKAENLPGFKEFYERLADDERSIVHSAKRFWNRPRPYLIGSEIRACVTKFPSGAYPSGHSTFGYMSAVILSEIVPEKRRELFEKAARFARNRLICGVHYRSDVEAGKTAGILIAAFALQNPLFRKELETARVQVRKVLEIQETARAGRMAVIFRDPSRPPAVPNR